MCSSVTTDLARAFERFEVQSDNRRKTLYLTGIQSGPGTHSTYFVSMGPELTQGLELGLEKAQTLRDNNLRQGLRMAGRRIHFTVAWYPFR